MLAPDAKTEDAHTAQRQNHEAFFPNRFARKRGNQMRDEAETRKHGDVDFGLREKPEEALPKDGDCTCDNGARLTGKEIQRGEKVRAQEAIREQADAGRQKNAENQHSQDGIDEPGPDGQREPGERHSLSAEIDGGDAEIERVAKGGATEDGNADDPERDAGVRGNQKRACQAYERGHCGPEREEV